MKTIYLILLCLTCTLGANAQDKRPLAIALAGLSHDHVNLMMDHYKKKEINLVGIAESIKNWSINLKNHWAFQTVYFTMT
ncbi:hypothetical protein [Niabella hibiscisoli]|uniref:hypothetical protein n=1 Tax=Niabella hibiscisoli TaxID=1825928 RepID=UPI001F0DFE46|nr:hypothetical protein [Niabella hibiscisoli]MCH5720511.1 hypothetical protein [Niabella hibiscisoli]